MKKRFTALLLSLCLLLTLPPATALAAAPSGQLIYVGGVDVTSGGYWTTDSAGNVSSASTAEQPSSGGYIHYNADSNTLTLHNATIKTSNDHVNVVGSAIGVLNGNGDAWLIIKLEDDNTIENVSMGIYVYSYSAGTATLTISGADGSSLKSNGSSSGIIVQSNSSNATLTIQNAAVQAQGDAFGTGVVVRAGAEKSAYLTVDGGSLSASGDTGIRFDFGNQNYSGSANLTTGSNALVDAREGGISVYGNGNVTPAGTGIVFNGNEGTVYGDVTLQDDLTVGTGESLNIPSGASLTIPEGITLTVNGGELTGDVPASGVIYKVIGVSLDKDNLVLNQGEETTLNATITPQNATDQTLKWASSAPGVAALDAGGKVTAVAEGAAIITVKTADGEFTDTCSVTVNHIHTLRHTEFKDATCTDAGNEEYWACETCGKYFSDAEGKTGIFLADTVIPAKGHKPGSVWTSHEDGHWHTCQNGCMTKLDYDEHTPQLVDEADATCTQNGYTGDVACLYCDRTLSLGDPIPATGHDWGNWVETEPAGCTTPGKEVRTCAVCNDTDMRLTPPLNHNLVKTEAKAADCTANGNREYWTCDTCGKHFSDADGNTEISLSDTVISAAGHCYVNGKCTVCGAVDGSFIPATNDDAKPAPTDEDTKSPQTGRNNSMEFMILLFAGCGFPAMCRFVHGRRKRKSAHQPVSE